MGVHQLTPDEANRLRAIRLRALEEAPDAFGSTLADAQGWPPRRWVEQLEELTTYVAVLDGADVGMVRCVRHADRPGAAVLISMWVAPQARGRGVGDALIGAVLAWARAQRCARVFLEVADENAPAVALYARHGFEPTGATGSLPPPREHIVEHERVVDL